MADSVGRVCSFVCDFVCLGVSVFVCILKGKWLYTCKTNVGRDIDHGMSSASIDPEVRRSKPQRL